MGKRLIAATALVVVGVGGCASPSPSGPALPNDAIPAGTARMTVDTNTVTSHDVTCRTTNSFTSITIGTDRQGITVLLDNAKALSAQSVAIYDVGGFTGSYWHDAQGAAKIGMLDQTYTISGSAEGFVNANPASRTAQDFVVKVAC